ncbi:MAG: PGPGW domain-containing protein [Actinomycetota bacterium]
MGLDDSTREIFSRTQRLPRTIAARSTRRVAVGILGGLLIITAVVIIPIPGPWSLALGLLGLTVLSWEFHWAKRLRLRLQAKIKELRRRRKG